MLGGGLFFCSRIIVSILGKFQSPPRRCPSLSTFPFALILALAFDRKFYQLDRLRWSGDNFQTFVRSPTFGLFFSCECIESPLPVCAWFAVSLAPLVWFLLLHLAAPSSSVLFFMFEFPQSSLIVAKPRKHPPVLRVRVSRSSFQVSPLSHILFLPFACKTFNFVSGPLCLLMHDRPQRLRTTHRTGNVSSSAW